MTGQRFAMAAVSVAALFGFQSSVAQAAPDAGEVPVSIVVTQKSHRGSDVAFISEANVNVYQGRTRVKVTDWVPLQGERANLELFILLDDSGRTSRGSQLEEIGRFILEQPASTKIGIAYMDTGGPKIVQAMTADHELAARALHASSGTLATSSSPFISLRDLIKHWPEGSGRREILMVSSGIDALNGANGMEPDNVYVDSAIEEAQRAGIVVSTIATSARDSEGGSGGLARSYLAQVAQQTGGESYYHAFGAPVSFAPYLEDSSWRLTQQYMLTFLAKSGKSGELQPVRVRTNVRRVELVSAEKVYVPGVRSN